MNLLFRAIRANAPQEIGRLIKEGANPKQKGEYGLTPLQFARLLGRTDCFVPLGEEPHGIQMVDRTTRHVVEASPDQYRNMFSSSYLPHLRVGDERMIQQILRRCIQGGRKGFFDERRRWIGAIHRPEIERGHVANVVIQWIGGAFGYGLFAGRDFKENEYVGLYTGRLIFRDLLKRNVNDYCFRLPTGTFNFRPIMIDAQDEGNELRFVNHSDEPNCETLGVPFGGLVQVMMRTTLPVKRGEQFTCDYGLDFWKSRGFI